MSALVVFDFETSGLKPAQGARVIEVGAVLVEGGAIRASFQRLINPGFPVSPFITAFTGISNAMLKDAPESAEALAEFCAFCGDLPMVAHNARFDRAFLAAELARQGLMHTMPVPVRFWRRAGLCRMRPVTVYLLWRRTVA